MNERFGAWPTKEGTSFRLWAPAAKRIDLLLEKAQPMQRGDDGLWALAAGDAADDRSQPPGDTARSESPKARVAKVARIKSGRKL